MHLSPPKSINEIKGWRNFRMGTHAHMCINTQKPPHTHTHTHLHTSTVSCLWNWKCDVTWTMTGVFVKDVAVTSNQWTRASSQGDFPLLRVWLVTLRFSAGWRTVSCQSGIQEALLRCHQIKKKINPKVAPFCLYSLRKPCIGSSGHFILTHAMKKKIIIWLSIHLKIVSMNKSENHCFRDVLFKQVV